MPSARVHVPTSATAGLLYSLHQAGDQEPWNQMLEGIGGLIGGGLGGRLPDQFDPPFSPRHRAGAHSATLGATLLALRPMLKEAVDRLRGLARERDESAASHPLDSLERSWAQFLAFIIRAFAGLLNGLYAGYLCHLGLDLFTPAGIPAI